jgi:putative transposase
VPDWFGSTKNEKRALLKASDGSSSVSDLKVHIVFATKRRGAVLTAPMVERFKQLAAQVVEEKGLGKLLAANCESDHAHLAVWIPVNVAPSDAMGHIKSFTSRHLRKEFPVLVEHHAGALWQRGGFVGSIGNGGDLSAVLKYIANQDVPGAIQSAQEDASDLSEDSEQGDE